jgi:alkylhydroperoxidase family enzyme
VLREVESAPLGAPERALLRFVEKVNRESVSIGPPDVEALHAAGWTDEAIYDAVTVCALFNFYNRWIDATGVHPMSDEAHRAGAARMAPGYIRTPPKPTEP